jgi:hypothetical protein
MSAIEKLTQLEESGKHLFHGSPEGDIDVLEPRQAVHYPNLPESTEFILDGLPAVSVTPYADIATFRALINRKNIPFNHTNNFGTGLDGKNTFGVSSEKVLDEIENNKKKGFVYVFDRKEFEPYNRQREAHESDMEWRSYNPVKPVGIIEVGHEDLPSRDKIEITGKD